MFVSHIMFVLPYVVIFNLPNIALRLASKQMKMLLTAEAYSMKMLPATEA